MSKKSIIKKMNLDHLEKIRIFNESSEEDKQRLAFDRAFWAKHDCRSFALNGNCLECGRLISAAPRAAARSSPPRRAVVSP